MAIKELLAGSALCEPAISRGSSRDSKFSQWSFPVAALEPSWCFMMCLQPWDDCPCLILSKLLLDLCPSFPHPYPSESLSIRECGAAGEMVLGESQACL